jgi:periplasmic protein TonB
MAFAHYEAHTPAPDEGTARSATSDRNLTLLLLLILAAVLFGWYRYNETKSDQAMQADTTVVATPAPAAPEARSPAAGRDTATTARAERRDTIARATPRSSAPSPIAGNPLPEYPVTALRRGEGGTVVLQVQVDPTGQPVDVDIARRSGSRELDRAAIEAVREWRFKPAIRNGKPVTALVELPIDFKPQG